VHDSIPKLIKSIRNLAYKQEDVIAPGHAIQKEGESYVFQGNPIRLTPTALRQLCTIAKMPADFFIHRLTTEEQMSIFNRIFKGMETEFMFRLTGKTLYGVVSTRYCIMDNVALIDILREADGMGLGLKPVKCMLNPDHTKIRLVSEQARVGELTPMIEFNNSQNGLGSLVLWAGVWRYACSNGLLVPVNATRSRWIHYGHGALEMPDIVSVLNVSKRYTRRLDSCRSRYLSAEDKVALITGVSQRFSSRIVERIISVANKEHHGCRTRFDYINALTRAAQSFAPVQQTEIECYAHTLLKAA
jgi:hypothetical protein